MSESRGSTLTAGKAVLIGCGALLLLAFLGGAVLIALVVYVVQGVPGATVTVEAPLDVTVGETFELVVRVGNDRSRKTLTVTDIDIAQSYLSGFVIVSVDPLPKSSSTIPFDDGLSHSFHARIPPKNRQDFTFTLRALRAGVYTGDVDVCEGTRFLTTLAQTVVSD